MVFGGSPVETVVEEDGVFAVVVVTTELTVVVGAAVDVVALKHSSNTIATTRETP